MPDAQVDWLSIEPVFDQYSAQVTFTVTPPGEEETVEVVVEVVEETPKKEVVRLPQDGMTPPEKTDDDIRALAKEAGIKSWHNKGIPKLKAELDLE